MNTLTNKMRKKVMIGMVLLFISSVVQLFLTAYDFNAPTINTLLLSVVCHIVNYYILLVLIFSYKEYSDRRLSQAIHHANAQLRDVMTSRDHYRMVADSLVKDSNEVTKSNEQVLSELHNRMQKLKQHNAEVVENNKKLTNAFNHCERERDAFKVSLEDIESMIELSDLDETTKLQRIQQIIKHPPHEHYIG